MVQLTKQIIYSGFTRTWDQVKQNQFDTIVDEGDRLMFYEMGEQLLTHKDYSSNAAGETSVINTLNQWRNRKLAFDSIATGSIIAIARTDTKFTDRIDFSIVTPGIVYIPEGQDYGGLNDQFAFGDYGAMKYYSELYDYIDSYWEAGCRFHPETLLAYHLRNTMVVRVPVQTQIIRL
jgi:hypothetical protein